MVFGFVWHTVARTCEDSFSQSPVDNLLSVRERTPGRHHTGRAHSTQLSHGFDEQRAGTLSCCRNSCSTSCGSSSHHYHVPFTIHSHLSPFQRNLVSLSCSLCATHGWNGRCNSQCASRLYKISSATHIVSIYIGICYAKI